MAIKVEHEIHTRRKGRNMGVGLLLFGVIGIVFGFIPARNAARLNPVDALSRE